MNQVGKIEKIYGHKATISVKRVSEHENIDEDYDINNVVIETDITDDFEVGDFVEITTGNEVMFKHIMVMYGVPFLLMIGTIALLELLLNSPSKDTISAVGALASLVVSYYILKAYDKKEMAKNTLKFTVGKKL